jgi:putative ATP-binding cassette transporter
VQIIPVLIVAPLYLHGAVEFGVVTQASITFSQIFNAFSLIAERWQDLSTFAAVIGRVGAMEETIAESAEPSRQPIQLAETEAPLAYDKVTLRAPKDNHVLVHNLSLEVPRGRRVLLTGPNADCRTAVFRAAAGLWTRGSGRISRPDPRRVMFLPEQPYMVPGSLRDQFLTGAGEGTVTDERILDVLQKVGLESLVERIGGLDVVQSWPSTLSLEEEQRIAFARLLLVEPDFAFLHDAASALTESERAEIYQLLASTRISYISVGERQPSLLGKHDTLVELRPDGSWSTVPINK